MSWAFASGSVGTGDGSVTVLDGSSFCLSEPTGDVEPGAAHGLFVDDTRILSTWSLRLDDEPMELLTVIAEQPYRAIFVGRGASRAGVSGSTLLVERHRFVGAGMREDIVVRNLGRETTACALTIRVAADLAGLFEVKQGRTVSPTDHTIEHFDGEMRLARHWRGQRREVRVTAEGATITPNHLVFRVVVPARGSWRTTVQVSPAVDGQDPEPPFPPDQPVEQAEPAVRTARWHDTVPGMGAGDEGLRHALGRSRTDLGALRIFDPEQPGRVAVAAGAPWYMALFGRDSLITALMTLMMDPALVVGTAQSLARHQGARVEPLTEEEPGRIPHEVRFGVDAAQALGGNVYYGTADASALFVMLLAEARRWGADRERIHELLPHADRALEWIETYGDANGDGFVEYRRHTDRGLVNQGWKDSWDGITFADGRLADAPISLCEVQGYVYAAYLARALLADDVHDTDGARAWRDRAARCKQEFNERFWLPERGWYALGLDRDGHAIDALASNMGHCLWTGIVADDKAVAVADRLLSPEMFSGWGVRTLATGMTAYNPMSYHNGSVWPHDNALIAAGLMRYGLVAQAQRVAEGVLDAATYFDGRLPELISGFQRSDYPQPVPYPTACSPQAWASAAPIELVRALLRFEPCLPHGRVRIDPALPRRYGDIRLHGVPLGGHRADIDISDGAVEVKGLPDDVRVTTEPCECTTAPPDHVP